VLVVAVEAAHLRVLAVQVGVAQVERQAVLVIMEHLILEAVVAVLNLPQEAQAALASSS